MANVDGKTRSEGDGIARAKFIGKNATIDVHFNPESLTLTFGNSLAQRGTNARSNGETGPSAEHQQANTFAATLSMKLVFDSTLTGQDVRRETIKLQAMLRPAGSKGQEAQVVQFNWGSAFKFSGTFASYTETLDYFSASGVPLRASVDLSMTENKVIEPDFGEANVAGSLATSLEVSAPSGASLSAALGGDSLGARLVAELNGEQSLRRLSGASLELDAEIELRGAVAFATGSLSLGIGVGVGGALGLELGNGAGFGASAGLSFDAGPGGGLGSVPPGLGFGAGFGGDGVSANGSSLPGASGGVAPAPFGFAGVAGAGAATGPARTFAADVASRPGAAAAAGVSGASSGLLSPVSGPGSSRSGVAFASANAGRAGASGAFAEPGASPTEVEGPVWGARASAGVPASLGAFAGLQRPTLPPRVRRRIDPSRLLPSPPDAELRSDEAALFDIGGRALSVQASGLTVDVGVNARLTDRIRFDEE